MLQDAINNYPIKEEVLGPICNDFNVKIDNLKTYDNEEYIIEYDKQTAACQQEGCILNLEQLLGECKSRSRTPEDEDEKTCNTLYIDAYKKANADGLVDGNICTENEQKTVSLKKLPRN